MADLTCTILRTCLTRETKWHLTLPSWQKSTWHKRNYQPNQRKIIQLLAQLNKTESMRKIIITICTSIFKKSCSNTLFSWINISLWYHSLPFLSKHTLHVSLGRRVYHSLILDHPTPLALLCSFTCPCALAISSPLIGNYKLHLLLLFSTGMRVLLKLASSLFVFVFVFLRLPISIPMYRFAW